MALFIEKLKLDIFEITELQNYHFATSHKTDSSADRKQHFVHRMEGWLREWAYGVKNPQNSPFVQVLNYYKAHAGNEGEDEGHPNLTNYGNLVTGERLSPYERR